MKIPSLEEGAVLAIKAIKVFVDEVEEFIEALIDKVKEMFG